MSADSKWATDYALRHLESVVGLKGVIVRGTKRGSISNDLLEYMHPLKQLEWLKLGSPNGDEIDIGYTAAIRSVREGRLFTLTHMAMRI